MNLFFLGSYRTNKQMTMTYHTPSKNMPILEKKFVSQAISTTFSIRATGAASYILRVWYRRFSVASFSSFRNLQVRALRRGIPCIFQHHRQQCTTRQTFTNKQNKNVKVHKIVQGHKLIPWWDYNILLNFSIIFIIACCFMCSYSSSQIYSPV